MGSVTGLSADRMLQIEAGSVVSGIVNTSGHLILTHHDGTVIDAGLVKGVDGTNAPANSLIVSDALNTDIHLSIQGAGTPANPWQISAAMAAPPKLMQLAPGYIGPGPAFVTDIGTGLGTQYGPYEWEGAFDPTGNPVVRLDSRNGKYVITGHAAGNSIGGWQAVPLASGWVPYGFKNSGTRYGPFSDFAPAVKTPIGIVSMQGLIRANGAKTAGTLICTLPVGMRPDNVLIFQSNSSDSVGEVRVYPNGTVYAQSVVTDGTWIDLSNVTFPAAGVATWTPLTGWVNGWSDYNNPTFGVASYWIDPYGVCWFNGLMNIGTASAIKILNLPAAIGLVDSQYETVACAGGIFSAIQIMGSVQGGGTPNFTNLGSASAGNWMSLAGLTVVTSAGLTAMTPYGIDPTAQGLYANSWLNYNTAGSGVQPPFIFKRPDGLVMSMGLIKSGTVGVNAIAIPERMCPAGSLLMANVANSSRGRIDIVGPKIDTAGTTYARSIYAAQGSNVWFSLDGARWMPGGY